MHSHYRMTASTLQSPLPWRSSPAAAAGLEGVGLECGYGLFNTTGQSVQQSRTVLLV